MPTGYTAGIIDGKIKTFSAFAKLCMRAFGATIHMRDDALEDEYVPRTTSNYHEDEITKAKAILDSLEVIPDDELKAMRKKELDEDIAYQLKGIEDAKEAGKRLNSILSDVQNWNPPTAEHTGIKEFMIQQITDAIKHDADTKYHDEKLAKATEELENMDASAIRKAKKEAAQWSFDYHKKRHLEEMDNCKKSNTWVADFIGSINNLQIA